VIHRADYQKVLVEESKRLGVTIRLNAGVVDVQHGNDTGTETKVILKDGEVVAADVVIGADGNYPLPSLYALSLPIFPKLLLPALTRFQAYGPPSAPSS
jgi:L-2-hydroxyglutarate oxidase LhgO